MGFTMKRVLLLAGVVVVLVVSLGVSCAFAAGTVAWSVRGVSEPSQFSSGDTVRCDEAYAGNGSPLCDRYQVLVENVGDVASSGPITVTDTLPAGITTLGTPETRPQVIGALFGEGLEARWGCSEGAGQSVVTCTLEIYNEEGELVPGGSVPAGVDAPDLEIEVSAPGVGVSGSLRNEVTVSGGGAPVPVSTSEVTPITTNSPQFELSEFNVGAESPSGATSVGAGAHPWTFTTSLALPAMPNPQGGSPTFHSVENVKDTVVELPLGFIGDVQGLPQCTLTELAVSSYHQAEACPAGSLVGSLAIRGYAGQGDFVYTGWTRDFGGIYNMVPEGGYPAEFGLTLDSVPVLLYASVVHGPSGYRLRVASTGVITFSRLTGIVLSFFGEPGALNGTGSDAAFLSNPADCSGGPVTSEASVDSWEDPERWVSKETTVYPQISECNLLQFNPSLSFAPNGGGEGTTQADEPSGYNVELRVPQTSLFEETATPELKNASVALPAGVAISPAAGSGLEGCEATGSNGFDMPEAGAPNVAGEGEAIGPEGLVHMTPGHCPEASTIGTAAIHTPLLPDGPGGAAPLTGHVYLAKPKCGGEGQPACTAASASNGELYGIYVEVQDPKAGVVFKLQGSIAADPNTGQLVTTFKENPQLPYSSFAMHFTGGPRASLANPQACGTASTVSALEPWSAPGTPTVTSSSAFSVDWDGQGGACPAGMPFSPGFSAGTVSPAAGAFSPFTLSFSRHDREQDLSGLSVTTPPGLLGKLAGVALCGEPQAAQGTCSAASQIGTATVAAGSGSDPLWVSGPVYLTGPYKGQPFGLSVVVPAKAGPFNLGNVVVRSAIHVDPNTAALTIVSDPLPQIIDGIPLRIQTVNVTINREGFIFNPTNCSSQQVAATITAAQGASAGVSSPFTASGCKSLPFHPVFSVSTQAKTSKQTGASLTVQGAFTAGNANVRSVAVVLPKQLPARLTTIQQACTEATFAANPASCPVGSNIGTATAITPVLSNPVVGPVYLVSHGGAAFPDVVAVLQGEGVTVDLTGSVNIKKGITSSDFAAVPDVPISSFVLSLPEGPHSGLAPNLPVKAKGSMCGTSLRMPFTITGQNGAQLTRDVKIAVPGCPRVKAKKARKAGRAKKHPRRAKG
jgi:hypothetical protein